jgi:SAM-dependent methyltransferase
VSKANERVEKAKLIRADAVDMPYASNVFDYVSNNYAFHHYLDKELAINEIYRVLAEGGIYEMHNIAIHEMPKWWVYHYFPSAYYEDLKRYWSKDIIFNELTSRGLEVHLKIDYRLINVRIMDYIGHVENRDISVLTLIDDNDYKCSYFHLTVLILSPNF